MGKKKKVKKNNKPADVKRILLLILGSVSVLSILFMTGFLIDYTVIRFAGPSASGRFSIIEEGNTDKSDEPEKKAVKNGKAEYSFFETLSKKNEIESGHVLETEKNLLVHSRVQKADTAEDQPEKQKETNTVYAVQLGSFKGFAAARTFRDKYMDKGYRAYIVTSAVPGKGILYRVRIGRFKRIEDAQEFSSNFEKKEKAATFITSK